MKYFYIICIFLSSFFTYKPLSATQLQYAFFIPSGAGQQNNQLNDLRRMRPRHVKTNQVSTDSNHNTKSLPNPQRRFDNFVNDEASYPTAPTVSKNISLPMEHKKISHIKDVTPKAPVKKSQPIIKHTAPVVAKPQKIEPILPQEHKTEIAQKLKKYKLDNELTLDAEDEFAEEQFDSKEELQLSEIEKLQKADLSELLDKIPFPNSEDPTFKQRYAYYGIELRILRRRNSLPANPEQEEVLSKANSIKRFEIK